MSLFRRFDLLDPLASTACLYRESAFSSTSPFLCPAIAAPASPFLLDELLLADPTHHVDVLHHRHHYYLPSSAALVDVPTPDLPLQCPFLASPAPAPLTVFEAASDLIRIDSAETQRALRSIEDRVAALELGVVHRHHHHLPPPPLPQSRDRTYKWTAERADRKYKCVAQAKAGGERSVKWTTEVAGKGKAGGVSRTYTFEASSAPADACGKKHAKAVKKCCPSTKVVEIADGVAADRGAVLVRKTFVRRASLRNKGKRRELSPQEAAYIIQVSFRQYLIRRSQALRALRDLAVAKAKLKEIRALFSNFSYRRRLLADAEERQRFSEKIIVLLLTVDAIEGADYMVRSARKAMIEELEAMLDVVDPQPSSSGRLGALKRRKFDLPETSAAVQKELALGVSQVVQLLDDVEGM